METASEGCDLDLLTKLQNKTLDSADLSTDARTVSDSTSVVTGSAEPPEDSTSTDDVISSSVKEMDVTSSNRGLCPNEQITALDNVSDVDSNIDKLKPSEVTESADCPDGDKDGDPMEVEGEPDVDVNKVIRDLGELNQIAEPMLGQNEEQTTDIDRSIVRETVQQQYTETDHQAEEMEHQPMEAESSVPEESSVTENQLENESSPSLAEHHRQLPTCGVKSEQLADGLDEVDACQPTEASHQYQSDPGITSASAVHGLSEGQVGQSTEGQISCDKGESSEMVCVSDIKQEVNNEVSSQGDELVSDVSDRSNDQTSDQQVAEKAKASCNVTLTVDDEKEPEVLLSSDDDAPSAKTIPEKQQNNSDEDVSFISEETKGKDSGAGDQENVVYSSNSADKSVVKTSSEKTMHPCLVCNKVGICKYNIVHNNNEKHLCEDACFGKFRMMPTLFQESDKTKTSKDDDDDGKDDSVEIVRMMPPPSSIKAAASAAPTTRTISCAVCNLKKPVKHEVSINRKMISLCSDKCFASFRLTNKLSPMPCGNCGALCIERSIQSSTTEQINFEGAIMNFCGKICLHAFKCKNKKIVFCAWCKQKKSYFDMVERVDFNNKQLLFCSLNCLSLYRVNLQATSNQDVKCDHCGMLAPAQYHLTMSDASIRNFCSYPCVINFQSQFTEPNNAGQLQPMEATSTLTTNTRNTRHSPRGESSLLELSDNERCCKGDSKEGFLNLLTLTSRESAAAVAESMLAKSEASQISILPSVKRRIRRAPIKLEDEMEIGPPKGRKRSVKCGKVGTPKVKDLLSLNRETKSCSKGQKVFYEDLQPVKDPDNKLSDSTGETLDVKDSFIKSCISPASVADYSNTGSCVSREKSSSASAFVVQDRSCSSVSSQDTLSDGEVCTKKLVGQQHSVEAGLTASIDKSNSESVRRSRRERKLTEKAASWVAARQGQDEVPIISDVVSLANKVPETKLTLAQQVSSSSAQTTHIIVQPPKPRHIKNKSLLCKPLCQTKATSCRPHMQTKSTQTDSEYEQQKVLVPVPVPIYIPTPMAMYAAPQPYPIPIPVPIPIPCFIPTTKQSADAILKQIKEIREQMPADPFEAELLMMAEAVATADQCDTNTSEDEEEKAEDGTAPLPVAQAEAEPLKFPASPEVTTTVTQPGEIGEDMLQMALRMASEISEEPVLDLEESLNPAPIQTNPVTVAQEAGAEFSTIDQSNAILTNTSSEASRHCRGRRGRGGRGGRGRVKRPRVSEEPLVTPQETVVVEPKPAADANTVLKYMYGVNAWKHWVAQKNALLEKSANTNKGKVKLFKTDILACTTEELNYSLSLFVKEFRKPNGEEYAPDSIFYLCLGIQQYLYENGRIDDIFSSFYYEGFTNALNDVLAGYEMRLNAHGLLVCRIEEEHLWESKQLGAHSPYILLNTLIYFNTKYFFLKTPEEHLRLSFSHIMKHWKRANGQPVTAKQPAQGQAKNVYLRYYAPTVTGPPEPGQKRKREEAPVYEQAENTENPLRCPVKLYEFYLSKCPESIKHRNDVFYLLPERSCVPDSPVWYSTSALSLETMTKMLNRLRLVREIQEAHFHNAPAHYGI